MPGHSVAAEIALRPTAEGGLSTPVEPGNRSLIFSFAESGEDVQLGAVVEEIDGDAEPGGRFKATLWFWHDVAAIHATPGAQFSLWYGGTVGCGKVVEVRPVW